MNALHYMRIIDRAPRVDVFFDWGESYKAEQGRNVV